LVGLKENVIMGHLIPAGTGLKKYEDLLVEAPDNEIVKDVSYDKDFELLNQEIAHPAESIKQQRRDREKELSEVAVSETDKVEEKVDEKSTD